MRTPASWLITWATIVLCGAGCKDDAPAEDPTFQRGAAGESCAARNDCQKGLSCIDNRCLAGDPGPEVPIAADGAVAMNVDAAVSMPMDPVITRGRQGESCTRRADCNDGLACIDNVCVTDDGVDEGMPTSARGGQGESCEARNDCKSEFACVDGRCGQSNFGVDVEAMECFRVECTDDDQCCSDFMPSASCPTWKQNCDDGDAAFCNTYNNLCLCAKRCNDELCTIVKNCAVDADCGAVGLKCFDGECAQCEETSDCTIDGHLCIDRVCKPGCTRNEECPLLFECTKGKCKEVGCESDRACFFATSDPRSTCKDGTCVTPCEDDVECTAPFHVCEDKGCVFAGCSSDEECRILLDLAEETALGTAVCR